jgi:hypothetical protein
MPPKATIFPYPLGHVASEPEVCSDAVMDPHERATSVWYRTAGLASGGQKDLAVEINESEIRTAQHEVLLEAAKLMLSGEPIEIARQLRDRAERTIRPKGRAT